MPYLMLRQTEPGHHLKGNDRYEGYCADLAAAIFSEFGMEYEIIPVLDGKYGSVGSDGQWNGMVGELMRGVSFLISYYG